jgi:hypothetical protein
MENTCKLTFETHHIKSEGYFLQFDIVWGQYLPTYCYYLYGIDFVLNGRGFFVGWVKRCR